MHSAASSTATLVSDSARQHPPTKDYQAAFGTLYSTYGFGGGVPSLPQKKTTTANSQPAPRSSKSQSTSATATSSRAKDYSAAFGSLASSFGFSGGVPSVKRNK